MITDEIKSYDDYYWQRYLREHTIFDVDKIKAQKDWLICKLDIAQRGLELIGEGGFWNSEKYIDIANDTLDKLKE